MAATARLGRPGCRPLHLRDEFANNSRGDLFTEVDHGPITITNNLFLSGFSANSAGNAYAHNLVSGQIADRGPDSRLTPSLVAHATDFAAVVRAVNGDHRLFNNVVVGPGGCNAFDHSVLTCFGSGSVYTGGSAGPSKYETATFVNKSFDAGVSLTSVDGVSWFLQVTLDAGWSAQPRVLVTTALLGNASIPQQSYTRADNSSFVVDDFFGQSRAASPRPGPFEVVGALRVQVWPKPPR